MKKLLAICVLLAACNGDAQDSFTLASDSTTLPECDATASNLPCSSPAVTTITETPPCLAGSDCNLWTRDDQDKQLATDVLDAIQRVREARAAFNYAVKQADDAVEAAKAAGLRVHWQRCNEEWDGDELRWATLGGTGGLQCEYELHRIYRPLDVFPTR